MPTITGTAGNDSFFGGSTDDELLGLTGDDTLDGAAGNDTLDGGAGDDLLTDSNGSARMLGGDGADTLIVRLNEAGRWFENIYLDGGTGNDFVSVTATRVAANATIFGGTGDDQIRSFGNINATIDAGDGADFVWLGTSLGGAPSTVSVTLGAGADRLRYDYGGLGTVVTVTDFDTGDAGDRVQIELGIYARGWDGSTNPFAAGYFQLVQQGADAVLRMDWDGPGTDGEMADAIRFTNRSINSFTAFNLFGYAANGAAPAGQTLSGTAGYDELNGGVGGDSIQGLGDTDIIQGRAGNDTLDGGAGDDLLAGEAGDDSLSGGAGNDDLRDSGYTASNDYLSGGDGDDLLYGEAGDDTAVGGAGNDQITETSGSNYLRGDDGNDRITGGQDFDDINGNQGDDIAQGGGGDDWVVGGKDRDLLLGDSGDDIVYGNLGDDTCEGGDGADLVRGGQGNDIVRGDAGNDWLSGDRGDDTVTGGAGADIFHGSQDAGIDRITDFNAAQGDRVQLDPGTAYAASQSGSDVLINMGGGNYMLLVGVQLSSLPAGWIFGA